MNRVVRLGRARPGGRRARPGGQRDRPRPNVLLLGRPATAEHGRHDNHTESCLRSDGGQVMHARRILIGAALAATALVLPADAALARGGGGGGGGAAAVARCATLTVTNNGQTVRNRAM